MCRDFTQILLLLAAYGGRPPPTESTCLPALELTAQWEPLLELPLVACSFSLFTPTLAVLGLLRACF